MGSCTLNVVRVERHLVLDDFFPGRQLHRVVTCSCRDVDSRDTHGLYDPCVNRPRTEYLYNPVVLDLIVESGETVQPVRVPTSASRYGGAVGREGFCTK